MLKQNTEPPSLSYSEILVSTSFFFSVAHSALGTDTQVWHPVSCSREVRARVCVYTRM